MARSQLAFTVVVLMGFALGVGLLVWLIYCPCVIE
jgi:hypothetical protein